MSPELLRNRAIALAQARYFFSKKSIWEVDCGALVRCAPIDSNIDVISATVSLKERGFLHTSPEYAMKRLLVQGSGDIYYLGHVYRQGECGRLHNPEFTMAEWYRLGFAFEEMIEETSEFIRLFLGPLPMRVISYKEAFEQYAKDAPLNPAWSETENRHYILSHKIEPNLGKDELTVLAYYPPNEAALARVTSVNDEPVAERFEIYYQGVELANGYHESSNADELKRRFTLENEARKARGQEVYALDVEFLESMEQGLPDCCGVSVGFDRVFMLSQGKEKISDIIPFPWEN